MPPLTSPVFKTLLQKFFSDYEKAQCLFTVSEPILRRTLFSYYTEWVSMLSISLISTMIYSVFLR